MEVFKDLAAMSISTGKENAVFGSVIKMHNCIKNNGIVSPRKWTRWHYYHFLKYLHFCQDQDCFILTSKRKEYISESHVETRMVSKFEKRQRAIEGNARKKPWCGFCCHENCRVTGHLSPVIERFIPAGEAETWLRRGRWISFWASFYLISPREWHKEENSPQEWHAKGEGTWSRGKSDRHCHHRPMATAHESTRATALSTGCVDRGLWLIGLHLCFIKCTHCSMLLVWGCTTLVI